MRDRRRARMDRWQEVEEALASEPRRWLVTGAAGFIGSHLVEALLERGQRVRGLDDFSTGHRANLDAVAAAVGPEAWSRFELLEGDVAEPELARAGLAGVELVLHQAALGSVPRSIADPERTHRANVDGLVALLAAARQGGVRRFVYASSSSVYGDHPDLPKREDALGRPLSPYAATKLVDEVYAGVFQRAYGLEAIGLRYFNVFGPRQDPEGPYAAVIPRWMAAFLAGERPVVHGDGETSRDFSPVENVVRANLLAAFAPSSATDAAYNVALGGRTTLLELFHAMRDALVAAGRDVAAIEPEFDAFRPGDVRHSLASLERVREALGYEPAVDLAAGLRSTARWFLEGRGG